MAEQIEIDVWQGEIADLEVDGIVVPANESLFMTSSLAAAVRRHAGADVEAAAVVQGPVPAGGAVVTHGGQLAAAFVIHAVAIGHDLRPDRERLASAVRAALDAADERGLRNLAMTNLGTDHGVFTFSESAEVLVDEIRRLESRGTTLETVVLAVSSAAERDAVLVALRRARAEAQ